MNWIEDLEKFLTEPEVSLPSLNVYEMRIRDLDTGGAVSRQYVAATPEDAIAGMKQRLSDIGVTNIQLLFIREAPFRKRIIFPSCFDGTGL